MSKLNNKQATIAGLEAIGFVLDRTAKSRKYLTYTGGYLLDRDQVTGAYLRGRPAQCRYLIGRSGALRMTSTTVDRSLSLTDGPLHLLLQQIGRRQIQLRSNFEAVAPC